MEFSVVSAVNNEEILRSCLLRSPDLRQGGVEILTERGHASAASAINAGLEKARADIVIIAHQDIYFPPGWLEQLTVEIEKLNQSGANWAVLGVYGVGLDGVHRGHLYCVANGWALGEKLNDPVEVTTLDEIVLVVRKSSGVRMDPNLPGFHFYGTDICLTARGRGFRCYAVPGFCVHNANEYGNFPWAFWQSYLYIRRKWKSQLPVKSPCIEVKRSLIWPASYALRRALWLRRSHKPLARRVSDPAALYDQVAPRFHPVPISSK